MTYSANLSFFATKTNASGAINSGIDGVPIGANTASTGKFTSVTNTGLTSGRIPYASTGGLLADSANLTFNGTNLGVQISRTSSTNGIALTLSDDVTGAQTSGVYKSIRSTSNGGVSVSEMRFLEIDGTNNNTGLAFATAPTAGGLTERMRIDNNGNVGIGTTTMNRRLNIAAGTAAGIQFQATGTSGRNYSLFATDSGAAVVGALAIYDDTAGAYRVVLSSSGNVGIGTTDPTEKLMVVGPIVVSGQLQSLRADSSTLDFAPTEKYTRIIATGPDSSTYASIIFATTTTTTYAERMRIKSDGNVGIGTSSPNAKLQVTTSSFPVLKVADEIGGGAIALGDAAISSNYVGIWRGAANSISGGGYLNVQGNGIAFMSTDAVFGSATRTMTLDNSGNLGIGTTSPSSFTIFPSKLVVGSGSGNQQITVYSGTSSEGNLIFADGTTGSQQYMGLLRYDHADNAMKFYVNGGTEAMRIKSNGNVVVGDGATTSDRVFTVDTGGGETVPAVFRSKTGASASIGFRDNSGSIGNDYTVRIGSSGNALVSYTSGEEKMRINSNGQLGVGTTMGGMLNTNTTPGIFINGVSGNQPDVQSLLVTGAKIGFAGISSLIQNQLCVYDSTGANPVGSGGAIVFGGNAGGGQGTFYCAIESSKDNGTAGDYGASLRFYTRPSGSYYTSPNMTITSGGSVGIGTISPSAPLTVKGLISSTSTPVLYLQQGGSSPNYGYRFNIDNVTTGNLYLNRLDGNTNTDIGSLITIRPDGNLGIGATNPTMKLRVDGELTNAGEGEAYVLQALYSKTSSGLGVGPAITFGGYYENTNSGFAGFASVIGFKENATSGNYGGALAFKTRPYGGSLTERMRIASDGNFALGTTSTTSAKVRFELTSLGATSGTLGSVVNVASFGTTGIFSLGGVIGNTDGLYFGTGSSAGDSVASGFGFLRESGGWNSAIAFYTNNVTSGPNGVSAITERMRLSSGGAFLVGQTSLSGASGASLQPNLATGPVGVAGGAFNTVWTIPPGTLGIFTANMAGNGQYGGARLFFVVYGAYAPGTCYVQEIGGLGGDQSGYSWSWQIASGGQFQMRNNTNSVAFTPIISLLTLG